MLPGDRLVCAFVEPQASGLRFKSWPLHLTIVPWFRLPDTSEVLAAGLKRALYGAAPIPLEADGEALFGPRKNRPVRLLQPSEVLNDVEAKVRSYLRKKRAWLADETTKRHYDFRPHVTAQGGNLLSPDATFAVDRLYIIEQRSDYKEVSQVFILGNEDDKES